MQLGDTQECHRKIESFLKQGQPGMARLKELLPLIFDSHKVLTLDAQKEVLRACNLDPICQTRPFHQVTFALPLLEPSEETSTSFPELSRPREGKAMEPPV